MSASCPAPGGEGPHSVARVVRATHERSLAGGGPWQMRGRGLRLDRLGRRRRSVLPAALAATGVAVGWRLLAGTYELFQHAYVGTYWAVPGRQTAEVYWASMRFAFQETVLVAAGVGVLGLLAIVEVGRLAGR
jgi:hypothetical protein